MEGLAFGRGLEIDIARGLTPVIELLRAHQQQINRDLKRTRQLIQSYHLGCAIRNTVFYHKDVEGAVLAGIAAGVDPNMIMRSGLAASISNTVSRLMASVSFVSAFPDKASSSAQSLIGWL